MSLNAFETTTLNMLMTFKLTVKMLQFPVLPLQILDVFGCTVGFPQRGPERNVKIGSLVP